MKKSKFRLMALMMALLLTLTSCSREKIRMKAASATLRIC